MNVAGIPATPPQVPVPAVAPVTSATPASADPKEHERHTEDQHREHQRRAVMDVPKMKPLSTTEVQVMLGMAPVEALRAELNTQRRPGFDEYA